MWQESHLHLREPGTWQCLTISQRKTGTLNQMEMRHSLLIDGFTRLAAQLCLWFVGAIITLLHFMQFLALGMVSWAIL